MAEIRVGGAYFTFSADANPYAVGVRRVIGSNAALAASYGGLGRQLSANTAALERFSASLTSSLVATVAYAAGVGAIATGLRGSLGGFIDYDKALIEIQKTTGITGRELDSLGRKIVRLGTDAQQGFRAFGVGRDELFDIAAEVGRAGFQSENAIERITRAASALAISSNLEGEEAVRVLTRILTVTGQSADSIDRWAAAITVAGNKLNTTEADFASFLREVVVNTEALGGVTDELNLALTGVLVEAGARRETAGTVLQRTLGAITKRVNEGEEAFTRWGRSAGLAQEQAAYLFQRLVAPDVTDEDRAEAVRTLFRGLGRLRQTSDNPAEVTQEGFLGTLFPESNVRIRNIAGILDEFDRLLQRQSLFSRALQEADAHYREAGEAAERYESRLQVVRSQMLDFATGVGGDLIPLLTRMAEAWETIGLALLGTAVALAGGKVQRAFKASVASIAAQDAAGRKAISTRAALQAQGAAELNQLKALQAQRGIYSASFDRLRIARAQLVPLTKAQNIAESELTNQRNRQAAATAVLNRENAILQQRMANIAATSTVQQRLFGLNRIFTTPAGLQGQGIRENDALQRQIIAQQRVTAARQQVEQGQRATNRIVAAQQRTGIRNEKEYRKNLKESAKVRTQLNRTLRESIPTRQAALAVQRNLRLENERNNRGLTGALASQDRVSRSYGLYAASAGRVTKSIVGLTNAARIQRQQVGLLGGALRGLTGVFNFLGGGLGVTLLGLTFLLPAITRFLGRAKELERLRFENFNQIASGVDDLNAAFEKQKSPLNDAGEAIIALREEYERLDAAIREQIPVVQRLQDPNALTFGSRGGDQIRRAQLRREERELETLIELWVSAAEKIELYRLNVEETSGRSIVEIGEVGAAMRHLAQNTIEARREVAEFQGELSEALASRGRVAALDLQIAQDAGTDDFLQQKLRIELAKQEETIVARQVALAAELAGLNEDIAEQRERVRQAQFVFDETSGGAKAGDEAEEQLKTETEILEKYREKEGSLLEQLEAGRRLRVDREATLRALRAENRLQRQLAENARAAIRSDPDLPGARRGVNEALRRELVRLDDAQRQFNEAKEVAAAGDAQAAAALEARNSVLRQHHDLIRQSVLRQAALTDQIADEEMTLEALRFERERQLLTLGAVNPALDERLTNQQAYVASLRDQRQEERAAEVRAIRLADAFKLVADERARLAALAVEDEPPPTARERDPLIFNPIPARRQVLDFQQQLYDAADDRIRAARLERSIAAESLQDTVLEQLVRREIGEQANQIEVRNRDLLNQRAAAIDDLRAQSDRLAAAEADLAALGDAVTANAVQRVEAERDTYEQLVQQAYALGVQLESARDLVIPHQQVLEAIKAENAALYEQTRLYQAVAEPDLGRARSAAESTFATDLLDAEEDQRRFASAVEERLAGSAREAAGIRAANDVMSQYFDAVHDARLAQADLTIRIAETREGLEALQAQAAADFADDGFFDPDIADRIREQADALQELNDEFAEQDEYRATIEGLRESYEAAAESSRLFAESAHEGAFEGIINEARRLEDNLESVVANGFIALGDEMVNFIQTGQFEFKEFANAVIADLLRVLVQAQVIAPLVAAIAPGAASAFSSITTAIPTGHSGGIAGSLPRVRHSGLQSDELLAVLQKGEEVLTARDPRHRSNLMLHDLETLRRWTARLPRFHGGGVAGGSGALGSGGGGITINLRNESRAQLQAVDNGTRISPRGMVRDIILKDAAVNGPITRGLGRAIR